MRGSWDGPGEEVKVAPVTEFIRARDPFVLIKLANECRARARSRPGVARSRRATLECNDNNRLTRSCETRNENGTTGIHNSALDIFQ